jgi:hypothetical protein
MNCRRPRAAVVVLTDDETRKWHSIFSRELREMHRAQIIDRCERQARNAGVTEYTVYDAYESLVARGQVTAA